eukprot:10435085-Karenia_brevis.AAC.1
MAHVKHKHGIEPTKPVPHDTWTQELQHLHNHIDEHWNKQQHIFDQYAKQGDTQSNVESFLYKCLHHHLIIPAS